MIKYYLPVHVTSAVNSSVGPAIIRVTFDLLLKAVNPYNTDQRFVMNRDEHTTRACTALCFEEKVLSIIPVLSETHYY